MKDTKKEIKDRVIDFLDKYARTDDLKLLTRLGIPADNFTTTFNTIERCRAKKQEAEKALNNYRVSKEGDYDELYENLRSAKSVYLLFLEELYQYLIGEKKLGEAR